MNAGPVGLGVKDGASCSTSGLAVPVACEKYTPGLSFVACGDYILDDEARINDA